jgi:hypothetical protein
MRCGDRRDMVVSTTLVREPVEVYLSRVTNSKESRCEQDGLMHTIREQARGRGIFV